MHEMETFMLKLCMVPFQINCKTKKTFFYIKYVLIISCMFKQYSHKITQKWNVFIYSYHSKCNFIVQRSWCNTQVLLNKLECHGKVNLFNFSFRCTCILEKSFEAPLRKRWEWKLINSHRKRLLEWSRIPLVAITEYLISLKRGTSMHTVWQHVWPHVQMPAHLLLPICCCAFAVVLWELVHPVQLSLWRWIQSTL